MKKFGTPNGAGPGSANENVGFDGVGTPPEPAGGGGLDADLCLDFGRRCLCAGFFVLVFDLVPEPGVPEWFGCVEEVLWWCEEGC
jgi:hypothetical protein